MAYHPGVGVDNLAVRLPPHFFKFVSIVHQSGHIGWYPLIKQLFEFDGIIYQDVKRCRIIDNCVN